ncbi:MAG TPA: hypothetical protein VFS08_01355, partial [Gemmatimonadaceae bacterium]|nr:hypothetical protein [Gemmatimonadaceae bacterium]
MSPVQVVQVGTRAASTPPASPRRVPHHGGATNPSADALRARFPDAVRRIDVVWGETTVLVDPARVLELVRWLHDDDGQLYDYLSDL